MELRPGRYTLTVPAGHGPAGVHRGRGASVSVGRDGGQVGFRVPEAQRVYLWWRGAAERPGLRVVAPGAGTGVGRSA